MEEINGELNYIEIGKRIREQRLKSKFTQEKLSELIDVSPSYISEIERGTSICSLQTISNLSLVLEISLDYLVFGITPTNSCHTFSEVLNNIPTKNQKLYISLCENIANSLK